MSDVQGHDDRTSMLVPSRLVGLGLLLVWDWAIHNASALRMLPAVGTGGNDLYLESAPSIAYMVAKVIALVAMALLFRRLSPLSMRRGLVWSGCAAFLVSTVLYIVLVNAPGLAGMPNVLLGCTAGVLGGFGYAVAFLLWAEVYGRLGAGRVLLFGALVLVAAPSIYLFIQAMSAPASVVAVLLASLLVYPSAVASCAYVGAENPGDLVGERFPFPVAPVAILALTGFMTRFIGTDAELLPYGDSRVIAELVIGAIILVALYLGKARVRPILLSNLAIGFAVAGVVCVAGFGEAGSLAAPLLLATCNLLVTVFVLAMLADTAYRQGVPTLYLFGLAEGARVLMGRLGRDVGGWLLAALAQRGVSGDAVQVAVGLAIILLAAILWYRDRRHAGWALEGIDIGAGRHEPSEHERLEVACARAREGYRLTEREADVLLLLLEGSTYRDVCQGLFLSMSTVKTHAHHAYEKLGVHTREEAMEVLGV